MVEIPFRLSRETILSYGKNLGLIGPFFLLPYNPRFFEGDRPLKGEKSSATSPPRKVRRINFHLPGIYSETTVVLWKSRPPIPLRFPIRPRFLPTAQRAGSSPCTRLLAAVNVGAWVWALIAFHDYPVLLGTSLLAYTFGLRHAVDADHIAAIDNVTRKLMQQGKRPVGVGFFFSLGHSTIVFGLSIAIALTSVALKDRFDSLEYIGGIIGTCVSAFFLSPSPSANILILDFGLPHLSARQERRRLCGRGSQPDPGPARILRPHFPESCSASSTTAGRCIPSAFFSASASTPRPKWALLGISATAAAKGLPIWSILVFPTLFTAGMALVDSTDSILMLGAYGWAFVKPIRKLYYNMTITFVSIVVALLIGGIEALGLIGDEFGWKGAFWAMMDSLNDNFGTIGFVIIGVFVVSWIASLIIYRMNKYDEIEVNHGTCAPEENRHHLLFGLSSFS